MTYGQRYIYERIGRSRQIYDRAYLQIGTNGISGQVELLGHKKTKSERHRRTGKYKPLAKDISSEGHC
jgi:hypothetical protein